jgi:hypothetical protein
MKHWYSAVSLAVAGTLAVASACRDNPTSPDQRAAQQTPSASTSTSVSGAAFTTTDPSVDNNKVLKQDGQTTRCFNGNELVNCNIYTLKKYVWLNGGPLTAGLESGRYFWVVLAPGGQPNPLDGSPKNLSDDTDLHENRTFDWNKENRTITYNGTHDYDPTNQKLRVGVVPPLVSGGPNWFADTPNPGGVYILGICSISAAGSYEAVTPRVCKFDAFKVKSSSTVIPPDGYITIAPNGLNEVGNSHTFDIYVVAIGGTRPYTFATTATVNGTSQPVTCDANPASVQHCTLTVNSTTPATFVVNASSTISDASSPAQTITRSTDGSGMNSGPATKYYVDASVAISPLTAKNGIGEQHKWTITLLASPGDVSGPYTFSAISPTLAPTTGITVDRNTCATPHDTLSGRGWTCDYWVTGSLPGTFTLNASGSVTYSAFGGANSVTVSRTTSGNYGPNGTGPATKVYVAGSRAWTKVDQNNVSLGGATFTIERTADRSGGALATHDPLITGVADCTAAPCTGVDQDPVAGQFRVDNLSLGTWVITETAAPTGYKMYTGPQTVTLTLDAPSNTAPGPVFVNPARFYGCTPGYWKNNDANGSGGWLNQPFTFATTLNSQSPLAFYTSPDPFAGYGGPSPTQNLGYTSFMTALNFAGGSDLTGKAQNLMRIATASLLNATWSDGNPAHVFFFPLTAAQIRSRVDAALASQDATTITNLQTQLDTYNNAGCPINAAGAWSPLGS